MFFVRSQRTIIHFSTFSGSLNSIISIELNDIDYSEELNLSHSPNNVTKILY